MTLTRQAITLKQTVLDLQQACTRLSALIVDETLPERTRQTMSEARMHVGGWVEVLKTERL